MSDWDTWLEKTLNNDPDLKLPLRIRAMYKMFGKTAGQQCKNCRFFVRVERGTVFFKCSKSRMSNSSATDWRAGWDACGQFEKPAE